MKKLITTTLLSTMFANDLPKKFNRDLYNQGEEIFENKCMECHQKSMPIPLLIKNFIEENNKTLNLKAPMGNEISFRLKQQIGSRDDIEFHLHQINDFLKDYLYNPDLSKTIYLEDVIRHFKVMPSMKGKITEKEIEELNHFLYFLEWFNGGD